MHRFRLLKFITLLWIVSVVSAGYSGPNQRPPLSQRKFTDPVIEDVLQNFNQRMRDPNLAHLWINCFPNTLDTTVLHFDSATPDTYIVTGDIDAMWLRDSSAQVAHYIPFLNQSVALKRLVLGVIKRQSLYILTDPYANAFMFNSSTTSPHLKDHRIPAMEPVVFEGKYELDSLMWPLRLSSQYFNATSDHSMCTDPNWINALHRILSVLDYQQRSTASLNQTDPLYYFFERKAFTTTETLLAGIGVPGRRCGLVKSAFRPSDDSHLLPFPVAANAMASVTLRDLAHMIGDKANLASWALRLSREIQSGLMTWGTVQHPIFGQIYAYEVDGHGSAVLMDDANLPGLLGLPYFGFTSIDDPVYQNTRRFLLSEMNPYFFNGTAGQGIGGPHIGLGWIWPISIATRALTSNDDQEILYCLSLLTSTTSSTFFMHESFWKDSSSSFTRPWFAWANSLFGELILNIAGRKPHLIFNSA